MAARSDSSLKNAAVREQAWDSWDGNKIGWETRDNFLVAHGARPIKERLLRETAAYNKLAIVTNLSKETFYKGESKMFDSLSQLRMAAREANEGQTVDIRLPEPDKEWAKNEGAKWDRDRSTYYFKSTTPDSHSLYNYRKDSDRWIKVEGKINYDYKDLLKASGVVGEKTSNGFDNWVFADGKYQELIETLIELGHIKKGE